MMQYKTSGRAGKMLAVGLVLAVAMTMGACVKTVVHPDLDVTFLPQKGEVVSKYGDRVGFDEIMGMARGKDYILIGEGHRNTLDHNVQQRLLAGLADTDDGVAVGLEMVAVDMQSILDDFGKGQVEVDALEEELQWNTKWGYDFAYFRGLFEIAKRNSVPVAGLNAPTFVTKKIASDGIEGLNDEEKAFLPMEIVPPSAEQLEFLDAVFAQHEARDSQNATQQERFRLVQSIWDSRMAEEAVRLRAQYNWPVLIIAGAGHVENGWGIARRIRQFDPGATILSIMPWRGGEFEPESGDVFFYSPDTYESKMGATLVATGSGGLLVEAVKRDSRAAKAGLRPGDVLTEASGMPLEYLMDLHMAGSKVHKADEPLVFIVRRGDATFKADVGKLGVPKAEMSADAEGEETAAEDKPKDAGNTEQTQTEGMGR